MRALKTNPALKMLEERILHHAHEFKMDLPEIRFFILNSYEFMCLLGKNVYPSSPTNIWEGRDVTNMRLRAEKGEDSSIFYEVVQCGDPSYAYLNDGNSNTIQASVMAHVCGHAEFSRLSLVGPKKNSYRTEYIMHLVQKINHERPKLGELRYRQFWNACQSLVGFARPLSSYNLSRSVLQEQEIAGKKAAPLSESPPEDQTSQYYSHTLDNLLIPQNESPNHQPFETKKKLDLDLERHGRRLYAPCEDIFDFIRTYSPATQGESLILNYLYETNSDSDFVIRTQIMNEGWAMYWEKKIMLELFRENSCHGLVEHSRSMSGVCYPRPWFQRNPYHVGLALWTHIEDAIKHGRLSSEYANEKDTATRESWDRGTGEDPTTAMRLIIKSVSDYEFIRRFLSPGLIQDIGINKVPFNTFKSINLSPDYIIKHDSKFVWIHPEIVREDMLRFFSHFYRPRIYVIDDDYQDGGLLLYHRDDGYSLKEKWIGPTLQNINMLWRRPCFLIGRNYASSNPHEGILHFCSYGIYKNKTHSFPTFEDVREAMMQGKKPLKDEAL